MQTGVYSRKSPEVASLVAKSAGRKNECVALAA